MDVTHLIEAFQHFTILALNSCAMPTTPLTISENCLIVQFGLIVQLFRSFV